MSDYFGKEVHKLGFGLMRLPKLDGVKAENGQPAIDVEQVKEMVDFFIASGGTYFDTAYVYDGGNSERAAKEALVDRYPRDSFTLATKLNARAAANEEEAKKQFEISLERTGAGYFDFYLLHAMGADNYGTYKEYHLFDFARQLKAEGKVKHWGFSFHDKPEVLDQILTDNPDAEFVQLQINYADWDDPGTQSRACLEMARKHGKSVVVMEPVKGGTLAQPPQSVMDIFKAADPDASPASWAIRFVASQDNIITVLSGMSNMEQMKDNATVMKDFKPLSDAEMEVIKKVQETLASIDSIPCTGCHYCTEGCPMQINIPGIFRAVNQYMVYENLEGAKGGYRWATGGGSKASDCAQCGQCEAACPQHISIIEELQKAAELLEA
ncbi:MAG: aldo/keto reductase [Lachnospiraceae bacterium]|nr:aldo/keto reductase [Lachnospiraceae bacterium]